jgi:hypothetical protein
MQEETGEEDGPEPAQKGLGWPACSDRPKGFLARFATPFALGVRLFIASAAVGRYIKQIILPTSFTRKPPLQDEGESWMSSSQGSTPAEGRKQEEDPSRWPRGVPKLHRRHLHRRRSLESPSPLCASIHVR